MSIVEVFGYAFIVLGALGVLVVVVAWTAGRLATRRADREYRRIQRRSLLYSLRAPLDWSPDDETHDPVLRRPPGRD